MANRETKTIAVGDDEIMIVTEPGLTTYALNGIACVERRGLNINLHSAATIQMGPLQMQKVMILQGLAVVDATKEKNANDGVGAV